MRALTCIGLCVILAICYIVPAICFSSYRVLLNDAMHPSFSGNFCCLWSSFLVFFSRSAAVRPVVFNCLFFICVALDFIAPAIVIFSLFAHPIHQSTIDTWLLAHLASVRLSKSCSQLNMISWLLSQHLIGVSQFGRLHVNYTNLSVGARIWQVNVASGSDSTGNPVAHLTLATIYRHAIVAH